MDDDNLLPEFTSQAYYNEIQYYVRKFTIQVITLWTGILVIIPVFFLTGLVPIFGQSFQVMIALLIIGLLLAVPMRILVAFWQAGRYLWFYHRPPYDNPFVRIALSYDNRTYVKRFDSITSRALWTGNKLFVYGIVWLCLIGGLGELFAAYIEELTIAFYQQYPTFVNGGLQLIADIVGIRILEILRQFGDPKNVAGLSFVFLPMAYLEMLALMNVLFGIEQKWISRTQQSSNVRNTKWTQEIFSLAKRIGIVGVVTILLSVVVVLIPAE